MNLGPTKISGTYRYVLNQSGSDSITLGDGSSVNWNAGGVVVLTGNQTISGIKTFSSPIFADLSGNARSVTNGVYTTGNQTISGIKTFAGLLKTTGSSVNLGDDSQSNNTFGNFAQSNNFGGNANENFIGADAQSNYIGGSAQLNYIGLAAFSNIFGGYAQSNDFGGFSAINYFGQLASFNSFAANSFLEIDGFLGSNDFGYGAQSNTFGNSAQSNYIGSSATDNGFGLLAVSNIFGSSAVSNIFGEYSSNSFGQFAYENSFGNGAGMNSYESGKFIGPIRLKLDNFTGNSSQFGQFGEARVSGSYLFICTGVSGGWGRVLLSTFS